MPLLPIDLQTLFGQAPQVGREQGIQRNGVPHAQALQGAQLVQRAGEQDASVNEARQQEEGPEQARIRVRREGRRRKRGAGTGGGKGRRADPRPADRGAADILDDPALGRHLDVTG